MIKSYQIVVVLLSVFFILNARAQCPDCNSQLNELFGAGLNNLTLKANSTFSDQFTLQALDQVFLESVDYLDNSVKAMVTNGKLNIRGKTGRPGYDGMPGYPGATGFTGMTGATGDTGFRGERGFSGTTGDSGSNGSPGPRGAQGATGATGPSGSSRKLARRKRQTSTSLLRSQVDPILVNCSDLRVYANGFVSAVDQLNSMKMVKILQALENVRNLQREVESLYIDVKFVYNLSAKKLSLDGRFEGASGMPGSPGMPGPFGATGHIGSKGPMGREGSSGYVGLQGYSGRAGSPGSPGPVGFTGASGMPGYSP